MGFGNHIRDLREKKREKDPSFSVRGLAGRLGKDATYLSKVEREEVPPPTEEIIKQLAKELDQDSDVLMAMSGRISTELKEIISKRYELFSSLIRELKDYPDHAILRITREVRDGDW